jgi:hypothetical protein
VQFRKCWEVWAWEWMAPILCWHWRWLHSHTEHLCWLKVTSTEAASLNHSVNIKAKCCINPLSTSRNLVLEQQHTQMLAKAQGCVGLPLTNCCLHFVTLLQVHTHCCWLRLSWIFLCSPWQLVSQACQVLITFDMYGLSCFLFSFSQLLYLDIHASACSLISWCCRCISPLIM